METYILIGGHGEDQMKKQIPFYNTRKWKSKRAAILKRDLYQCRNCKRFGRIVPANTVHHSIPLESRADLKLDDRNLLSLCTTCHEQMHNKFTNTLTELGLKTMERTLKKYPEIDSPHE